jgi:hypothetical protein
LRVGPYIIARRYTYNIATDEALARLLAINHTRAKR